eukprot:TRINITY_DN32169_c0_g1_i1.p1 TRINITY_DN32169_c0_g1~~TRINITY_DN32169_c0_g1_i1.p1  ORF type:complete len:879 (+),score=269.38 TRINITY_DN32169_c0_g1_i1:246-2639(+)
MPSHLQDIPDMFASQASLSTKLSTGARADPLPAAALEECAHRQYKCFAEKRSAAVADGRNAIIDELLAHLRWPPEVDPYAKIISLAKLAHACASRFQHLYPLHTPLELLLLWLYSQEGPDVDRVLGWADAPPSVAVLQAKAAAGAITVGEAEAERTAYRVRVGVSRNPDFYACVAAAGDAAHSLGPVDDEGVKAWVCFAAVLTTATTREPIQESMNRLVSDDGCLSQAVYDEFIGNGESSWCAAVDVPGDAVDVKTSGTLDALTVACPASLSEAKAADLLLPERRPDYRHAAIEVVVRREKALVKSGRTRERDTSFQGVHVRLADGETLEHAMQLKFAPRSLRVTEVGALGAKLGIRAGMCLWGVDTHTVHNHPELASRLRAAGQQMVVRFSLSELRTLPEFTRSRGGDDELARDDWELSRGGRRASMLLHLRGVTHGLPMMGLSSTPQELEVLLAPFQALHVLSAHRRDFHVSGSSKAVPALEIRAEAERQWRGQVRLRPSLRHVDEEIVHADQLLRDVLHTDTTSRLVTCPLTAQLAAAVAVGQWHWLGRPLWGVGAVLHLAEICDDPRSAGQATRIAAAAGIGPSKPAPQMHLTPPPPPPPLCCRLAYPHPARGAATEIPAASLSAADVVAVLSVDDAPCATAADGMRELVRRVQPHGGDGVVCTATLRVREPSAALVTTEKVGRNAVAADEARSRAKVMLSDPAVLESVLEDEREAECVKEASEVSEQMEAASEKEQHAAEQQVLEQVELEPVPPDAASSASPGVDSQGAGGLELLMAVFQQERTALYTPTKE